MVCMPEKDALLEMNWVSLLEKQWNSVKQCAMLTPLVFRWNGKTWTVALASCPTVVLLTFRLVVKRRTFTSKVQTTTITATTELGLLLLRRVLPPLSTLAWTVAHHRQHTMNIPQ